MKINKEGLNFIAKWEGTGPIRGGKFFVYKDVAGYPTIGHGHLLTRDELSSGKINIGNSIIRYYNGLTKNEVLGLLDQDSDIAENAVNKYTKVSLTQNQFNALVSFTFNVGTHAFRKSTLLKVLNRGLYNEIPKQLLRWVRAGGRKVRGLINRRNGEIKLWNS